MGDERTPPPRLTPSADALAGRADSRWELVEDASPRRLGPLFLGLTIFSLSAAQGGYFPTAWGWGSLALLWVIGVWLVVSTHVELSRLDVGFLCLLAGLAGWIALSITWSVSPAQSVLEVERAAVYLAGGVALIVLGRRATVGRLLGAVFTAIALLSAYSLATRLFPDRLGVYDPVAVYRLSEPLGYWNGLGIFTVMGVLLGLGLAAFGASRGTRVLGAAALPVLASTLYFTFSRASWIALGFGALAAIVLTRERLRLVTTLFMLLPAPALAVWVGSQSRALTHQNARLAAAARDGHRFALVVVGLAAVSGAVMLVLTQVERHVRPGRWLRVAYACVLASLAIAGAVAVFARFGGPVSLVDRGYRAFTAPPPRVEGNLNRRLFSFSGNGRADLWAVAWDDYEGHRLLGSGAGSFERFWLPDKRATFKVKDAHGLYIEALAELGPPGAALLIAALALPLAAAVRARRMRFAPALFGAYAAFLVHAGVDWDWELSGVTLTALACGALLVIAARPDGAVRRLSNKLRFVSLAAALAVAAFAVVGLLGNSALASSRDAVKERRWERAKDSADRARAWMPWSPAPWIVRGEAQLGEGELGAARVSFEKALAKDDGDWRAWLDLGLASRGHARRLALTHAVELNRTDSDLARLLEASR